MNSPYTKKELLSVLAICAAIMLVALGLELAGVGQ